MNRPFVPDIPEKFVKADISVREDNLIKKLRKYPFGKFLVHKVNNLLIRIEINNSELIEDETKKS